MTRSIRIALLLAAVSVFPTAIRAADPAPQSPYGAVQQILQTTTSVVGEPLRYPEGAASVRTVIVTLQPGESTARHHHATPIFVYILQGDLSVEYEGVGKRTYRAGDTFMEAMSVSHVATNVGTTPVRILATFLETAPGPEPARSPARLEH